MPPVCGRKGETLTGPNPVDRGKNGSKIHVLSEAAGLPLVTGVSAANTHDSLALQLLVMAIPPVGSRRGPRRRRPDKARADKGYDFPTCSEFVLLFDFAGATGGPVKIGRPAPFRDQLGALLREDSALAAARRAPRPPPRRLPRRTLHHDRPLPTRRFSLPPGPALP
jgi:hypothetical protein